MSLIGTQILVCLLHLRTPFSCIGVNRQESNETGSCALSSLCLAVNKKVEKERGRPFQKCNYYPYTTSCTQPTFSFSFKFHPCFMQVQSNLHGSMVQYGRGVQNMDWSNRTHRIGSNRLNQSKVKHVLQYQIYVDMIFSNEKQ